MNCKLLVALVALYIAVCAASKAELLFQKKIVDGPVVGKELEISFVIYNVGEGPAYDLAFTDSDFTASGSTFEIVKGTTNGKWEVLEAGTNVSQTLTVVPSTQGIYPLTPTVLSYRKSQQDDTISYTAAASYSGMYVESVADYDKRTSLHLKEWGTFVLLCLGSVAFPISILTYYKMNYVDGIKKKN
ncbi:translocon-associated protein subunit beta [Heterostelium album PN500]|uniref:Translocon-associated protein subunit beta n=1 Tax=Heterostelium pallidum (strain ATCC 26659 / Pp 5 / PN500) TaxID=670386 RepID=D3BIF7_HETP5|nr:translocon-associated protein subunit beta [Heterostelium album PN500]EFA79057.1 translocon-associated protein subunit beta [Heterostelium album PN500]|eukprot:XP_020431180.1 translocon-associated protein subunit beta [Heterostelium album PN500]